MNRQYRIRTRRSLFARLWDLMEVSWWPAIAIYAVGAAIFVAATWSKL